MKNVVILTSEYPPWSIGGVGRYVHEIVPFLRERMTVNIFVVPTYYEICRDLSVSSETGLLIGSLILREALSQIRDPFQPSALENAATALVDEWAISNKSVPSTIYVQDYALAPLACEFQRRYACGVVAICHLPVFAGFTYFDRPVRDSVHQILEAQLVQLASSVVVPSKFAAHVLSMTHNGASKTVVIPLGVARPKPVVPACTGPINLLVVGRPTEQKGYHFLLEALEHLVDLGHRVRVTIVSGSDDNERLQALINNSRVRSQVTLKGQIGTHNIWSVIDEHQIVVSASVYETFGLSVLEAMASRRPAVGFSVPALCELWGDELSGVCSVPIARTTDLARKLAELIEHPDRLNKLAHACEARAQVFGWAEHIAQLEALFDDQSR